MPQSRDSILHYKTDSTLKGIVVKHKELKKYPGSDSSMVVVTPAKAEVPEFRFSDVDTGSTSFQENGTVYSNTEKLFKGHSLQPVKSAPEPISRRNADWFTMVLVVVVISFTWIKAFYYKIFRQLVSAFFSNSITNQIVRDENMLVQRASILMSFIFYLIISLFIYQVSVYNNWDYPFLSEGIVRFLVICLIVAFTYSFKMILMKMLGELFNLDKQAATYIFNIFLINNMLGLVLIPVVVTIAYVVTYSTSFAIYAGVTFVIISFIYRLVRAFVIWLTLQGVSFFYLILYFCTLEIAPLIIVIKLAKG